MGYLEDFEQNLRIQLAFAGTAENEAALKLWLESTVDFVKKAVLESYRNGLKGARGASKASGRESALAAGKLKPAKPAQ